VNILIVKLGSIGDIVHTLPALAALRRHYPEARIDWLVETRSREILLENPCLDDLMEVDTLRWRRRLYSFRTWKEIRERVRTLRSHRYDVVFDFQGLVKSGVCARLARSLRRVGFGRRESREPLSTVFTNERVSFLTSPIHVIDKNLSLLKAVGIKASRREFPIRVPVELDQQTVRSLDSMGLSDFVAMNPGGGWPTKLWSPERFGKLAAEIGQKWGFRTLVFWGPGEDSLAQRVEGASERMARMAPPTSLREMIAFLKRARLFIGGDTGPFHIAGALGVPVVGLFGPSDPAQNGPVGEDGQVVWKSVPCSPCYKRRCPGYGTICMTSMEISEVLDAVRVSLQKKSHRRMPVAGN
jgi:lipopolysaccharide heptosyltransferase I